MENTKDEDPEGTPRGHIRMPGKNWVQFNEDGEQAASADSTNGTSAPAVIDSSVEIVPPTSSVRTPASKVPSDSTAKHHHHHSTSTAPSHQGSSTILNVNNLHNVELNNSQGYLANASGSLAARRPGPGFTNGDVIVSVLPVNTKWPWVTPASFRPELVPEELMVPGLTLTVEEYVHAMDLLTSDFRFNAYTICYKRLLAAWLSAAFFILLIILFSGVVGISLFALGIAWLIINAAAVFLCMYIKIKINQGLERCLAKVNRMLLKHKLIVGLDDRGRISCHKVHLCFMYFDPTDCIKRLEQVLEGMENRQQVQRHLDASDVEIVITGQNTTRIPQKQRGERLFLRYIQRWAKDFLRRRLDWTVGEGGENPSAPRHLTSALCPCQYVEEYLKHKPISPPDDSGCKWWMPCFKLGSS